MLQGFGQSDSSSDAAKKEALDLVRSLRVASLLGKLRSAIEEVDEQLAATMVRSCQTSPVQQPAYDD